MIKRLVDLYRQSHLGNRLPAYDGSKSLYTAGPLPFSSNEFKIVLIEEDDTGSGGQRFVLALTSYRLGCSLFTHIIIIILFLLQEGEGERI